MMGKVKVSRTPKGSLLRELQRKLTEGECETNTFPFLQLNMKRARPIRTSSFCLEQLLVHDSGNQIAIHEDGRQLAFFQQLSNDVQRHHGLHQGNQRKHNQAQQHAAQKTEYTACQRVRGTTKWSFRKLMNYAIEGIVGFSTKPLRIATYIGSFTAIAALIYLIAVVIEKLAFGIDIPGYATQIVLILLLGGVQLLCIGIIGEYVGKIFEQSKDRPIYIAKEIIE